MRHGVANVGQTKEHQWNADDGVQNGDDLAQVCNKEQNKQLLNLILI